MREFKFIFFMVYSAAKMHPPLNVNSSELLLFIRFYHCASFLSIFIFRQTFYGLSIFPLTMSLVSLIYYNFVIDKSLSFQDQSLVLLQMVLKFHDFWLMSFRILKLLFFKKIEVNCGILCLRDDKVLRIYQMIWGFRWL